MAYGSKMLSPATCSTFPGFDIVWDALPGAEHKNLAPKGTAE